MKSMYFLDDSQSSKIFRSINWSKHCLGSVDQWPIILKSTLSIMFRSPTPMFLFWGQDLICFHNDGYLPILGSHRGFEVMGQPAAIARADMWETTYPQIKRVLQEKKSEMYRDFPIKVLRKGKLKEGFWNYSISPVIDETGESVGILTTYLETTETILSLKKLQDTEEHLQQALHEAQKATLELAEAKVAAENAHAAKSAFLANMSHEIRTPLGAIMGFSELAREKDASEDDRNKYLTVMQRNSHQVLRIVDDILDLANVEAGKVIVAPVMIEFAEFLNDFVSSMSFRANENGICFIAMAATPLPDIIVSDPTRLRQVLLNAIGNAIKFTANGFVRLQVCYENNDISFIISDTGRGISEAQAKHLFKPFIQADASTTRKFGGTGLGLVLTRKLCQILGGNYSLEQSELGKGSTFKATVKVQLSKESKIVPQGMFFTQLATSKLASSFRNQYPGTRVLIVEDCVDNQDLLKILLDQHGVEFDLARNGNEGVAFALKKDYDLILMDIQMPVMDGHQAVRYLRQASYSKPIVALTAHALKEEAELARLSGFTEYLSKPITREGLVTTLEKYRRFPEGNLNSKIKYTGSSAARH